MSALILDGVVQSVEANGEVITQPQAMPPEKVGTIFYTVATTPGQPTNVRLVRAYPSGGRPVLPVDTTDPITPDVIPARVGDPVTIRRDVSGALSFVVETEVIDWQPCPSGGGP